MQEESGRSAAGHPLDALVWSSAWIACAVAALTAASARAMGLVPDPVLIALAFCGTAVVYVLDRLRDVERDRPNSPLRTAFITRHRRGLLLLVYVCAPASLVLGWLAGPRVIAVAAAVLFLGVVHRWMRVAYLLKPLYVALSATAVMVGFPWAANPAAENGPLVAAIVALCIQANVVLYNLRDGKKLAARLGGRTARSAELLLLALALGLALTGPGNVPALRWLPLALIAALTAFRPTERYCAWVVDGALLAGGLLACALPPLPS